MFEELSEVKEAKNIDFFTVISAYAVMHAFYLS